MTALWSKIVAWFKSRNITTHTIGAALVSFWVTFASDQSFRDGVLKLFSKHPEIIAAATTAVGLYLKYSAAHSAAGILKEVPQAVDKLTAAGKEARIEVTPDVVIVPKQ